MPFAGYLRSVRTTWTTFGTCDVLLGGTFVVVVVGVCFYAMSRQPPRYPRVVTRPRLERRFVVLNEYGFKVSDHTTLAEATAVLERLPYRGTTFGVWYAQRREERERR